MRILHIDKSLGGVGGSGGVFSYVRALTQRQRADGHQVTWFGCTPPGGDGDGPEYRDFTATRNPLALARMIDNADAAARLDALLRRSPADVAHLHNIYHHLTPSILPVLARRGVAVVMTLHDYRLACPTKHFLRPGGPCMRCLPNKFWHACSGACAGLAGTALAAESYVQRFGRRYIRGVDRFICPSRFMRRVMVRAGLPRDKCVVVPNVVHAPPLAADVSQATNELLFAGRLSDEKGPMSMLDLARRLKDVHVTIAGGGPLLAPMKQAAAEAHLTNVTFAGDVGRDELGRLLARATAVIVPSRCLENSPATMLEAMAAGRCVIVAAHAPMEEWVIDGRTGRTFTPLSDESLAEAAGQVLADAPGRSRMVAAARELVLRRHDEDAVIGRIEQIYRESIGRCVSR